MSDDVFYEMVAAELESNQLIKSLWLRCYADSSGDDKRTESLYIKRRVRQLKHESFERAKQLDFEKKYSQKQQRKAALKEKLQSLRKEKPVQSPPAETPDDAVFVVVVALSIFAIIMLIMTYAAD